MKEVQPYETLYKLIEQHIQQHKMIGTPPELYEPMNYIMSLGGKRLRPVLVLMAADMYGADVHKAIHAAHAVEVFHNFTLVHDDIMDKAYLRRGNPTVHIKWNETIAILSGDLMMIKAIDILAQTDYTPFNKLLSIFNKAAVEVCEGQQLDMNFENQSNVTTDEYINMITLKTAVLLATSLQLGALIGGASEADAQHLYNFGKHIGIAFQIQDDILDSFGDGEKVGKKIGGDIAANKKTLLLIEAFNKADESLKNQLHQYLLLPTEQTEYKIQRVLEVYNQLNVKKYAEEAKEKHLSTAFKHLDALQIDQYRTTQIRLSATELMQRMS